MANPRIAEAGRKTQFPLNQRKDHTKKGPYFKPFFLKLLREEYPMQSPTGELVNMQGGPAIALAVIWEALRGDVQAAREIMDRVDGRVPTPIQEVRDDERLIDAEFEIIPNGDKPNAIERFKGFLS